jgi:hypothetical protein
MQFAVDWIHRYCPGPTVNDKFQVATDAYLAATRLHEVAMEYSNIWDLMAQLHRGAALERLRKGTIRLEYADPDAEVFDTCSHLFASPDAPDFTQRLDELVEKLEPAKLLDCIVIRRYPEG